MSRKLSQLMYFNEFDISRIVGRGQRLRDFLSTTTTVTFKGHDATTIGVILYSYGHIHKDCLKHYLTL